MKQLGICIVLIGLAVAMTACGGRNETSNGEKFTKADSLTETYLMLQDTMLQAWNVMVKDENEKIRAMHDLLHILLASKNNDQDQLVSLEQRLDQLERIRFDQKSMSNPHVVEEYDFSSNSLVSELITLAESEPGFSEDSKLQNIVDRIRTADQRVDNYREEYDRAAAEYNLFLEENKGQLNELDQTDTPRVRVLFRMAEED